VGDSVFSAIEKFVPFLKQVNRTTANLGCAILPSRKEYAGVVGEIQHIGGSIVYTIPSYAPGQQGGTLWSTAKILRDAVTDAARLYRGEKIEDPSREKLASQLVPHLSYFNNIKEIGNLTPLTVMALIQSARRERPCVELAKTVEGRDSGTVSLLSGESLLPLQAGEPIDLRRIFSRQHIDQVASQLDN
jgi:hypothetical protein